MVARLKFVFGYLDEGFTWYRFYRIFIEENCHQVDLVFHRTTSFVVDVVSSKRHRHSKQYKRRNDQQTSQYNTIVKWRIRWGWVRTIKHPYHVFPGLIKVACVSPSIYSSFLRSIHIRHNGISSNPNYFSSFPAPFFPHSSSFHCEENFMQWMGW